jgi:hypothetical protein
MRRYIHNWRYQKKFGRTRIERQAVRRKVIRPFAAMLMVKVHDRIDSTAELGNATVLLLELLAAPKNTEGNATASLVNCTHFKLHSVPRRRS